MSRIVAIVLHLLAVVMLFTAVFFTASAHADEAQDKVVYKKKTLIDFSDVTIEGELRKPDGAYYGSRKRTRFGSLIKVRENFVEELKASVDSL